MHRKAKPQIDSASSGCAETKPNRARIQWVGKERTLKN